MEPNDHIKGKKPWTFRALLPRRRRNGQTSEVHASSSGLSESGSIQRSSSNGGPTIFDSAANVKMTGGQITTHHGDRTSVTININGSGTSELVQIGVAPASVTNPIRNRTRPEENMIRPVQRSNEVYERHLMLKRRGFPLWIPQPNMLLPIPYRAKGVCIGDVGIVTAFGGFDFLFNICRARDDPINPEELPDNFTPINLNLTDVRAFREFSSGSYLASSSIVESQTAEQNPGLTFESSASEGAILTMPDGAFQEELGNLSKFRDYIGVHATNWYKFVNGPRGREAQNGDVRVVVGCDKTTSWGMATFSNTSSAQQAKFRLKFRPLQGQPQHSAGSAYVWEHSGIAEVRVGPEPGENEELGETPSRQFRNQCLFMRTLSVTLSDSVWAETLPGTALTINQHESQPERGQHLRPSNSNTSRASSSSSNPTRSVQGKRRALGPSESEVVEEEDKDDEGKSTPIPRANPSFALAKESALSRSPRHHGLEGPTSDSRNLDDIALDDWTELYCMILNLESAQDVPSVNLSSAPVNELAPSHSPGNHIKPRFPTSDNRDSDNITSEETVVSNKWVNKLYHMVNDLELDKHMTWSGNGTTFILWDVRMLAKLLGDKFSRFVHQLTIYDFHPINLISLLSASTEDQAWEIFHPKFMRGRPDLLHEIKEEVSRPYWDSWMNYEENFLRNSVRLPVRLSDIQIENMKMWHGPSKIINKYLLDQVPCAKIALTHDRDWSYVAGMGISYLDPSKLLEEVIALNAVTVDIASGAVFLEPKNELLITDEEQTIIDQIDRHEITIEEYLFGSNENHSALLHHLINQLRSECIPFHDEDKIPTKQTSFFLPGHPKRFLSLDDLVDIRYGIPPLTWQHHRIHSIRNTLKTLVPQHPDEGRWLLRLADALSRRFWQLNQREDLEEAIWYYDNAVSLLPNNHYHFLEAILGLCSALYHRFQLLGHLDDLTKLLDHLHTERNLDLEFLLTRVKAQLQDPSQIINEIAISPPSPSPTVLGKASVFKLKEPSAPQGSKNKKNRWIAKMRQAKSKFWKPNRSESSGKSDLEIKRGPGKFLGFRVGLWRI